MSIEKDKRIMEAATPGEWRIDPRSIGTPWNIGTDGDDIALSCQLAFDEKNNQRTRNAEFMARFSPARMAKYLRLAEAVDKFRRECENPAKDYGYMATTRRWMLEALADLEAD